MSGVSNPSLNVLKKNTGASKVGMTDNRTVQQAFEAIDQRVDSLVLLDTEGSASAIDSLNISVLALENGAVSTGQQLTTLSNNLSTVTQGLDNNEVATTANSEATTALTSRVEDTETALVSSGQQLTTLSNNLSTVTQGLDNNEVATTANSEATTALTSRVEMTENGVIAVSDLVTTLSASVGENEAAITQVLEANDGASARWEVKTDVNDLVGGVGFYNDGTTTSFVVNAMVFSLGHGAGLTNQGVGALAMGNNAGALDQGVDSLCLGNDTVAKIQGVAIGKSATAFERGVSIGYQSYANDDGIAIGQTSVAYDGSVILGTDGGKFWAGFGSSPRYCLAIGSNTKIHGDNTISLGSSINGFVGVHNISIGAGSGSGYLAAPLARDNTVCLGANSTVTASDQVQVGDSSTTVFSYGAVQNRSDARDKIEVTDSDLGLNFIMGLRPVNFKWDYREDYKVNDQLLSSVIKDGSKARTRKHYGLIAQEVKALIDSQGVDFGGYQDHSINGGDDVKSLGYEEFIAPLIKAVQELSARVQALESV